jgi:hypothetical protein
MVVPPVRRYAMLTRRTFSLFGLVIPLAACVVGKPPPPADPNFTPTRTYSLGLDQLWSAMIDSFQNDRIAIASSNKSLGQMTTDYAALSGSTGWVIPGAGGQENLSRVKWTIFFKQIEPGVVSITIAPTLEVMTTFIGATTGTGVVPYHDVTSINPGMVQDFTNSAFRIFEKKLPPGTVGTPVRS